MGRREVSGALLIAEMTKVVITLGYKLIIK